ncbi:DUF6712 family protein [Spirosoma endophyticum]|uniref:Uncharacterized protein n=1 Tax=Spirosoma endophyticum TaxID=662367 RepID=A0A1I1SST4_9BACT|nr:DUF6712 family protein [Spirosoma endophyticum]SFD46963.1 hypothetical protein SAMN05216167_105141 [Spirosoma endophyticum]
MKMLINDIAELKAQIGGVQKTMAWPTWEPAVRQSEMKYIIPAIGQEFYDELTAVTVPTAQQKPLLDRLKAATAFFAYLENLPFLMVATGDAGMVVSSPANTQILTKWMFVATLKDVTSKADFWLEDSLQYLEKHASDFETWTASDAYTVSHGRLIPSASAWTAAYPPAQNSRRLFLQVRGYLQNAEDSFIRPILGADYFEALMAKLKTAGTTLTPKETNVVRLARIALANYGFSKALPYLNMNADFRIVSETDGIVNEDELDNVRLNVVLKECQEAAANTALQLTDYLNANASSLVFQEYFLSDRYRPPVSTKSAGFKNDSSNPFFVL